MHSSKFLHQKPRIPLGISNSASCHQEAASLAEMGSERYDAFEESLNRFRSNHKKESRELSQKFEWIREISYLRKEEIATTGSMISVMESVQSSLKLNAEPTTVQTNDETSCLLRDLSQVIQWIQNDYAVTEKEMVELRRALISLRIGVDIFSTQRRDTKVYLNNAVHENEVRKTIAQPDALDAHVLAEMLLQYRERIELMHRNAEVEYQETLAMTREARTNAFYLLNQSSDSCSDESLFPSDLSKAFESLVAANDATFFEELDDNEWVQTEISMLQKELKSQFEELDNEERLISETDCILGDIWDKRSHSIFVKLMKQQRPSVRRTSVINKLLLELPHKTEADILKHRDWWERTKLAKHKQKSATNSLQQKRKDLIKSGLRSIENLRQSISIKAEQTFCKAAFISLKESQRTRLAILRELREKAEQEALSKAEERRNEICALEHRKQQREAERRIAQMEALTIYQEERQRKIEEARRLAGDNVKRTLFEYEKKLHLLKERTFYRENLRSIRIQERNHELMNEYKREQERIERLDKLAHSAPYYEKIKECRANIHKTTCARKNDIYEKNNAGLADFQLNKIQNFSNERLFSNIRFKLADAFFAAGVANSSYAKSVIKRLVPREPERTTGIEPF